MARIPLLLLIAALGLGLSSGTAQAQDFAVPSTPAGIQAAATESGVRVSWEPVLANPPVTAYIVHAGAGSCPVIVPTGSTRALMPVPAGLKSVLPQVQAVNAYGISPSGSSGTTVDTRDLESDRFRVLQFLLLSDFHGALLPATGSIGAARLATIAAQARARIKPTFLVSAGDNFGGSPAISSEFDERPTVDALNLMGLDVSTVGNHEHDRSLVHFRQMIDRSRFRWVAANYSTLAPLRGAKNQVTPSTVIMRNGLSVGFVGMNTEEALTKVLPEDLRYGKGGSKVLAITPSVVPVNRAVARTKSEGAEVTVSLLHQGFDAAEDGVAVGRLIDVARQLRGVDLIFGGHSHQQYASVVNGALVVETEKSGSEVAEVQTCLDTARDRVLGSRVDFVTAAQATGIAPEARTEALVNQYQQQLASRLDRRVGVVNAQFPMMGTDAIDHSGEYPIGDFAADAVRAEYQTDFALLNRGGMRDSLPALTYRVLDSSLRRPGPGNVGPFDVVLGDVISAFPFGENLTTSVITGDQLWAALENGVSGRPDSGKFPQVSGLRFTYDGSRPVGSRILSVTRADGRPIPRDATEYSITTIEYLLKGGNGYTGFFNPQRATSRDPLVDIVAARLTADLASAGQSLMPLPDGRATNQSAR